MLCVVVGVRFAGYAPDDMFISYRYAWNLAHGEGLVFNSGERIFGLTNPGHSLVLALLHAVIRIPVHILGGAIYAVGLWLVAVLVWVEARRRGLALEAAVGGTLLLGSSYVWTAAGSASASVLALLGGSALLVARRPSSSGALAGLAVWHRPDAVLGVIALGALTWLKRRRPPWRWGFVTGGVILLGVVTAWLWFGSILPNTLEAKRIMAEARGSPFSGSQGYWRRAAPLLQRHLGSGCLLLVALGLAGQWPLFSRGGPVVRTLVLYGAGVAVAYPLLGVPFFVWYSVPVAVALFLGVAALVVGVGRGITEAAISNRTGPWSVLGRAVGITVAVLLLAPPVVSLASASARQFRKFGGSLRHELYRAAGLWIRDHSLPDERIAYGEIGLLAYWSRRPVDDLMGLVTPEFLPYVAVQDYAGAFLLRPPDLYLQHPASPHPGILSQPWFRKAYHPVATLEDSRDRGTAVVYRKRPGAELPPSRPPREPQPRRKKVDAALRSSAAGPAGASSGPPCSVHGPGPHRSRRVRFAARTEPRPLDLRLREPTGTTPRTRVSTGG